MALNEQLLDKLACPRCKGELEYQKEKDRLECDKCKLNYRVVEDIPVLLIDEAETVK